MTLLGPTVAFALTLALGQAAEPSPLPAPAAAEPAPAWTYPWHPEERMDFEVHYLGFTIGKSRMSVGPVEDGAVLVQLASGPAGLSAALKFHQTLQSTLDLATLLPRSSVHDASEPGGYKHTDTTRHDRAAHQATVREKGRFDNTYQIDVPPEALDFVTMVFRLRTLPLPDGASHTFQVLAGRKIANVVATVVKREQVKTDAGRFAAIKVRIPTRFDGKFSEKSPTHVWFSDDVRRVVVKLSVDFAVGHGVAELVRYQPGQAPPGPAVEPVPVPATPPAEPAPSP
jgi:Protein of unknown function (DUF3108)